VNPVVDARLFRGLEVRQFNPHLCCVPTAGLAGCGAATLSLLSGVHPLKIFNTGSKRFDWKPEFMEEWLRERGFLVMQLSPKVLAFDDYIINPITKDHVLLVQQHLTKNECSWAVIFGDLYFHNFEVARLNSLEFINHPLERAYVIWHQKWNYDKKKKS
jgi:hypothetical protein